MDAVRVPGSPNTHAKPAKGAACRPNAGKAANDKARGGNFSTLAINAGGGKVIEALWAVGACGGLLVYASVAVAVWRFSTRPEGDDCDAYQRIGTALTCVAAYVTGIVVTASVVQLDAPHGEGWLMALAAVGGVLVFGPPFVSSVAFLTCSGHRGRAAMWPVAIPLGYLVWATWWTARRAVALVWGASRGWLWLASLPGRRERVRQAHVREVEARHRRTAEMEREIWGGELGSAEADGRPASSRGAQGRPWQIEDPKGAR